MKPLKFLIILFIVGVIKSDCPKYSIPKQSRLRGYIEYHHQNLSGYPKDLDMGQLMTDSWNILLSGSEPKTLKFVSAMSEPFVFAINDEKGFTVCFIRC